MTTPNTTPNAGELRITDQEAKTLEAAHREQIELAKAFAIVFGIAGLIFAFASGAVVLVVSIEAPLWVVLPVALAALVAAVVAIVTISALRNGRRILETLVYEWSETMQARRDIERDRLWIETNITIGGRGNTVLLSQANQAADNKSFVYVRGKPQTIEGIDVRDWNYFIDRITVPEIGFTKRRWLGTVMPSGWKIAEYNDYARLVEPLERANILLERGERYAGRLALTDPERIKAVLGIPSGSKDITPADPDPDQAQGSKTV